ncbi:hypothetical protein N431DRAFT_445863 [Stipitochalara longipes BDJ]|nr:hypothetical protein N431DRAFT_445863 [Stipitochalara longipes BDJ]
MLIKTLLQLTLLARSLVTSSAFPTTGNSTSKLLEARQASATTVFCGCGNDLDPATTNEIVSYVANDYMPGQDIEVAAGGGEIWPLGNVVAFMCNSGSELGGMSGAEFQGLMQGPITQACGSFVAGTWTLAFTGFELSVGYMLYNGQSGADICGAANSSPKSTIIPADGEVPFVCLNV